VAVAIVILVAVLGLIVLAASLKIVQEYERGVIFRLGRCVGAKGPGVFFVIPILDKIVKANLQEVAVPVQPQQVITKDNVTLTLDAVAFLRVIDPVSSVVKVQNWYQAAGLVAQTTLRSVIGHHELDELLSSRDQIDGELKIALDRQTEDWGVEVRRVELRDLDLPEQIQRAMGRQAEAERDRRAKIIAADGELQASVKLSQAAAAMSTPAAMQLRTLQTMAEISTERNSTIVFPIPVEIMHAVKAFAVSQEVLASQALAAGLPFTDNGAAAPSAPGVDLPPEEPVPAVPEVPPLPDIPPPPAV
jgi:regulator of protease activity HflC (stomatin/prohibitin superfamily)